MIKNCRDIENVTKNSTFLLDTNRPKYYMYWLFSTCEHWKYLLMYCKLTVIILCLCSSQSSLYIFYSDAMLVFHKLRRIAQLSRAHRTESVPAMGHKLTASVIYTESLDQKQRNVFYFSYFVILERGTTIMSRC